MNFETKSDDQLHVENIGVGHELKSVTLRTLHHLNETEKRRLYSRYSCSSLHAYAVKFMKMDDATAGRHISAARLLSEIPEIEDRILNGTTQMTSVADAGVFFRKEARLGKSFDLEEKREVMLEIDAKTTRQAERVLISKSTQPEIHFKERVSLKTASITEVKCYFDHETFRELERLREIWSQAMPHASFADLIKRAVHEVVEKIDPVKKAERSQARTEKLKMSATDPAKETPATAKSKSTSTSKAKAKAKAKATAASTAQARPQATPAPESRAKVKHNVWLRDRGQCTYVDPRPGECCKSKFFVEEDHIIAEAMGGEYTVENLRLTCRAHNQRHAIETFGAEKMNRYLN